MNKDNYIINVWGIFYLVFLGTEYLFNLYEVSIYTNILLLTLLALYYLFFKVIKLKYIPSFDIFSWIILTCFSVLVFLVIKQMGYGNFCETLFCLNGFRFYYYLIINLLFGAGLALTNIFVFVLRLVKKN
ncbi:MAG: hypothetical protein RSB77_07540 [Bacilli bacterium]